MIETLALQLRPFLALNLKTASLGFTVLAAFPHLISDSLHQDPSSTTLLSWRFVIACQTHITKRKKRKETQHFSE